MSGKSQFTRCRLQRLLSLFSAPPSVAIPGAWMLVGGLLFNGCWIVFALVTLYVDRAKRAPGSPRVAMG